MRQVGSTAGLVAVGEIKIVASTGAVKFTIY
jgi:hypothetical protein